MMTSAHFLLLFLLPALSSQQSGEVRGGLKFVTKKLLLLKASHTDAVLITGSSLSDTAELYQPSTGLSCALPQLPYARSSHTLERSGLMCGGLHTSDTCLQWSPETWDHGSWQELHLDIERNGHVSWTPDNGIGTYLMGGYAPGRTTTLVKHDGTQEAAFPLKYDTR